MYELFYKRRAISRGKWSISLQHTSHIPLFVRTPLSFTHPSLSHPSNTPLSFTHTSLSHTLSNTPFSHTGTTCTSHTHHTELYEYCLNEGYADKNLIAKWKKVSSHGPYLTPASCSLLFLFQSGYENLCCLRCIQPRDTNFGTTCVCRVPKSKLESVCCGVL